MKYLLATVFIVGQAALIVLSMCGIVPLSLFITFLPTIILASFVVLGSLFIMIMNYYIEQDMDDLFTFECKDINDEDKD